jgi:hypothetical protein
VGLVESLMEVAAKLGAMKDAKVCSRDALVQVAKARLAWVNRDHALRLATKLGWTQPPPSGNALPEPFDEAATEAWLGAVVGAEGLARHALPLVVLPGEMKAMRFLRLLPDETVRCLKPASAFLGVGLRAAPLSNRNVNSMYKRIPSFRIRVT